MMSNPLFSPYCGDQLAGAVSKALGVQLFLSDNAGELAYACELAVGPNRRPLPLMAEYWHSPDEPIFWAKAVHAGTVLGLAAARVPRRHQAGQPLADALAGGLLYRGEAVLAGRNWSQGRGPQLPAPGASIYLGLEWAAPLWRACGLPGALTRLALLSALSEAPDASLIWALDDSAAESPGALAHLVGPELPRREEVFAGFYPPLGRHRRVQATWCSRAEAAALLQQDIDQLDAGRPLPWLQLPPVPLRGRRA